MTDDNRISCSTVVFCGLSAEILLHGKSLRFRARGTSMQPLVRDGDILLVQPVGARLLQVGEVVLCSSQPERILVHRVVRRLSGPDGYRYLVQGDQVAKPDGLIPQAQVYGRVAAIERAGVHIDMQDPVLRLLGWLAVLRSRTAPDRGGWFRFASQLVKRLPIFSTYLT